MTTVTKPEERTDKKSFILMKRSGDECPCRIPGDYSVEQAKDLLAERAGYEPKIGTDPLSVRLAIETESGRHLLPDDTRFDEIDEEARLVPIPSLAPASHRP